MKNIATKKIVLWGSLAGTLAFFVLGSSWTYQYCFQTGHCWRLWEVIEIIMPLFVFVLFVFLFSLITYKMREEVFRAWWNFARWWVPLSIFLTLIMPGSSGGGFGIPSIFDKEFLAFILAALFFIISLVIIVRKSLKLRGEWNKK